MSIKVSCIPRLVSLGDAEPSCLANWGNDVISHFLGSGEGTCLHEVLQIEHFRVAVAAIDDKDFRTCNAELGDPVCTGTDDLM